MKPWQSDFNADFAKSRRRFNFLFNTVLVIVMVAFVAIVGLWILAGTLIYKSADEVKDVGLKAVIERVWCGPNAKCL